MSKPSETDTVIKRVLPYLKRRDYDPETDLDFETPMQLTARYAKGYADVLVTCGKAKPQFLIEAKRDSRKLNAKDRDQAIEYGETLKVPFVVVTNGKEIQCYNTKNKSAILWNGKLVEKIPSKDQLTKVLAALRTNSQLIDIPLGDDLLSPFRPALPLKQLNGLFKRCHNTIRKIEKNEESAFADFSKLLFLKLLEEKADVDAFSLPYSYRFYELADKPASEADQVKVAIDDMLDKIRKLPYGEVLGDPLKLRVAKTYRSIVRELAAVYFEDSNLDSKGAAFEYFVRATLKGKKLGQYFTPRPLIETMVHLYGKDKIVNALLVGDHPRVLDPACGTGGFLVYFMRLSLSIVDERAADNKLTNSTAIKLTKTLKESTFYGSDANQGVACSAKMNMIVAGDGHTNILPEDSLTRDAVNWSISEETVDLILTNPPFGTSESDSLSAQDRALYPINTPKGQYLFLQKMVLSTKRGGEICTIIDEGVLNTDTGKDLRRWILQNCQLLAVLRLPEETFKPNKINVRSSVLYLKRYNSVDHDLEKKYSVTFCDIESLGYEGSGDPLRNFDFRRFLSEVEDNIRDSRLGSPRTGYHWRAFDVLSSEIAEDATWRLDLKYWEPLIRTKIKELVEQGGKAISELNLIPTLRGKSPNADLYVDEADGFAAVVKAGSSITKFGDVVLEGDYVEKVVFDDLPQPAKVQKDDVLLASTGEGTLGKCGLYDFSTPAVADGHVTIIRVDGNVINPRYLTDYLRRGFGAVQIQRLYSGSTGLIELTPDHVKAVIVDTLNGNLTAQKTVSKALRDAEIKYQNDIHEAQDAFEKAAADFRNGTISLV